MGGSFRRLPGIDRELIVDHARSRGINTHCFTKLEYLNFRNLAQKMHLRQGILEEFDKDYEFTHSMARKVRTGAINSISGMCYVIAIYNYAKIANTIESGAIL